MTNEDFELDLDELSSAEDFLEYFHIEYDPAVVQVNRLHILQRFHDYLEAVEQMPDDPDTHWALHADLLAGAYQDFVGSDALTEKVFRVFRVTEPQTASVALTDLTAQLTDAT